MSLGKEAIRDKLLLYKYAYYIKNDPLISDREYDVYEKEYVAVCGDDLPVEFDVKADYAERVIAEYNKIKWEV